MDEFHESDIVRAGQWWITDVSQVRVEDEGGLKGI